MMQGYEAEVRQMVLGFWVYRLLLDGEPVKLPRVEAPMYGSREAALEAAKQSARRHRDLVRGPERVPIEID